MKRIFLTILSALVFSPAFAAQQTLLMGEGVYLPTELPKINENFTELYGRAFPLASTADNDFSVGNGTIWQTKTLAETKTILSVPDEVADLTEDATHRTVTDAQKTAWTAKAEVLRTEVDASTSKELSVAQLSGTIVGNDGQTVSADVAITTATLVAGLKWDVIIGETLDSGKYWQITVPVGSSILFNNTMGTSGGKCRFTTPVMGNHAKFTTFTINGGVVVLCESTDTTIACD